MSYMQGYGAYLDGNKTLAHFFVANQTKVWWRVGVRLKEEIIKKIATRVVARLKEKNVATFRVPDSKLVEKVIAVITADMVGEEKLDEDARKMMDQYRGQMQTGAMDERKLFLMIKKQLAKDRKIIL